MSRDPRIDPQEGDVLIRRVHPRFLFPDIYSTKLIVDRVEDGEVYVRALDADGSLYRASKISLEDWRRVAPWRCKNVTKKEEDDGNYNT